MERPKTERRKHPRGKGKLAIPDRLMYKMIDKMIIKAINYKNQMNQKEN